MSDYAMSMSAFNFRENSYILVPVNPRDIASTRNTLSVSQHTLVRLGLKSSSHMPRGRSNTTLA